MFAMSVSPLTRNLLSKISPDLEARLDEARGKRSRSLTGNLEYHGSTFRDQKGKRVGKDDGRFGGKSKKDDNIVTLGGETFEIQKYKGKKMLALPLEQFKSALEKESDTNRLAQVAGLRGKLLIKGGLLLEGEKVELIAKVVSKLNLKAIGEKDWPRGLNVHIGEEEGKIQLINNIDLVLRVTMAKSRSKEFGFICLFTDGKGTYWFKVSRGFATALNESLASLEKLVDDADGLLNAAQKEKVNMVYRLLNSLYE